MNANKYPPKIEKFLKENGLLDKSIIEKKKSHVKAMKMIEENFTKEERQQLIEAMKNIRI